MVTDYNEGDAVGEPPLLVSATLEQIQRSRKSMVSTATTLIFGSVIGRRGEGHDADDLLGVP